MKQAPPGDRADCAAPSGSTEQLFSSAVQLYSPVSMTVSETCHRTVKVEYLEHPVTSLIRIAVYLIKA
nr:MAG TPA: hypothetical protein [Caudoviricetes sp.]